MAAADTNGAFLTVTRHEDYYISGADFYILVEHTQFRVHRYFFERESKWFASKLITPASPGSQPHGSSESNAIILENLTPTQFAKFLWVFYNPRYSIYDTGPEDWEVILSLAERWGFPEVKKLSIRELEKKDISDVKRIKLYQENNVDRNILIPRYAALCEREEPLTLAEGLDLGMETTLQIASGREQARSARLPSGARSPLTPTIHGEDLREVIRELFKIAPATAAEESPIVPGALPQKKQAPKAQQATPPPPPQKPTEKPKIQTKTLSKKGKGTTTAPPSTTTTTPAKGTGPPPPQKEDLTQQKETKPAEKANEDEKSALQKNEDLVHLTNTDSTVDLFAPQVNEPDTTNTTPISHLPDLFSDPLKHILSIDPVQFLGN